MRVERVTPGRRVPARLVGAVLARDLTIGGSRWSKGRRLSLEDLLALAAADPGDPVTVLVPEAGELHEDEAAVRLAAAVGGPGLTVRGPSQSRVDLIAAAAGVVNVRIAELERLAGIGQTAILGLPTCGAYSKATAADLLLPRLLSGEPGLREDRREAWVRRQPDPQPAVPLLGLRPRPGRARWLSRGPTPEMPSPRGPRVGFLPSVHHLHLGRASTRRERPAAHQRQPLRCDSRTK